METFDRLLGFAENRGKNVLVVEDDITQLNAMVGLIGTGEMQVTAVVVGRRQRSQPRRNRSSTVSSSISDCPI